MDANRNISLAIGIVLFVLLVFLTIALGTLAYFWAAILLIWVIQYLQLITEYTIRGAEGAADDQETKEDKA